MVKVRRGNVILRVAPEMVNHYLQQGFDAYDENGNLSKRATVKDASVLQMELLQADKTICDQKNRIAELEAQIKALTETSTVAERPVKQTTSRKKKSEE